MPVRAFLSPQRNEKTRFVYVICTNLTGKNRNTGRCKGVFVFPKISKILTLYAQTWGRGLMIIAQRDLYPPMGYTLTDQEQAPTNPATSTAESNKKNLGVPDFADGSPSGWGVPPPPHVRVRN